jgi:Dimethlysulfonioproprionate lyase
MNPMASDIVREPRLEAFLASLTDALAGHTDNGNAELVLRRIFDALRLQHPASWPEAQRLPVCVYLAEAIATARTHSATIAKAVDDFVELESLLRWAPRASGGPLASENWSDGHANATIVGRGGLESRDDVQIGVSLLAPHVRYPDHHHSPEEVYLVLSRGRFKHGASSWFEPGIGGSFHNEPNIDHAMASDDSPLLAIWCLWSGKSGSP